MNAIRIIIGVFITAALWAWYQMRSSSQEDNGQFQPTFEPGSPLYGASQRSETGREAQFRNELGRLAAVAGWREQFAGQEETGPADNCVDGGAPCPSSWLDTGANPQTRTNCSYPYTTMRCSLDSTGSPVWLTTTSNSTGTT